MGVWEWERLLQVRHRDKGVWSMSFFARRPTLIASIRCARVMVAAMQAGDNCVNPIRRRVETQGVTAAAIPGLFDLRMGCENVLGVGKSTRKMLVVNMLTDFF